MTLSLKVNLILLPVILLIFSSAGLISYHFQKGQIHSLLSEKTKYELKYISSDLTDAIVNLDLLSQLFLESNEVRSYLNKIASSNDIQYSKDRLMRYVGQLAPSFGEISHFDLFDSSGHPVFVFNSNNPFAEAKLNHTLNSHLNYVASNLNEQGMANFNTTIYEYKTSQSGGDEMVFIRTFSPDLPLGDRHLSNNHLIYTSVITVRLEQDTEYLQLLKKVLGEDIQLDITSNGSTQRLSRDYYIEPLNSDDVTFGFQLKSELFDVVIALPVASLSSVYKPFKVLFILVVSLVSLVTFLLLKGLIASRVIDPLITLTEQIELTQPGDPILIDRPKNDDEVSLLTNRYLDLIEELDGLAKFDSLTGLANRSQFDYLLRDMITHCSLSNLTFSVFYLDIDNFKSVNDRFGHHAGNELLKSISAQLTNSLYEINQQMSNRRLVGGEGHELDEFNRITTFRLSGDQFALIVPHLHLVNQIKNVSNVLLSLFEGGFSLEETLLDIGLSAGVSIYPDDAVDAVGLARHADIAMYAAKRERKNWVEIYSDRLGIAVDRNETILSSLRLALAENKFNLVFMPIYEGQTGNIAGCEVLLRSSLSQLEPYGPDEFIPVAEKTGVIKDIDYWVIESAIKQLSLWIKDIHFNGIVAINFSSWQLKNPSFVDKVASLIEKYQVPPQCIEFEITETCFVPGEYQSVDMLSKLRNLGVRLSLDDFGTGYTAFSQLIHYPIDTIKIDRMFINEIDEQDTKYPLVDMIVDIANLYGLNVVAEGVETQKQWDYVRKLGCQQAQGFLLSKPLSEADFVALWLNQEFNQSDRQVNET